MSGIKLVVFDIAGTIIEDHGETLRAFRTALMENEIRFVEVNHSLYRDTQPKLWSELWSEHCFPTRTTA